MLCADGPFLAVADRIEVLSIYAKTGEVILCGICPLLSECQVVLNRTSLVTIPFYSYLSHGVGLEPVKVLFQYLCIAWPDIITVKIKINIIQDWSCHCGRRRCGWHRYFLFLFRSHHLLFLRRFWRRSFTLLGLYETTAACKGKYNKSRRYQEPKTSYLHRVHLLIMWGISTSVDIPPKLLRSYFFSGAGAGAGAFSGSAGFSGAGAAFSGAGAGGGAGFASSFAGGGGAEGPQPTSAKLAKNVIAIHNTNSFFISFTSFLL